VYIAIKEKKRRENGGVACSLNSEEAQGKRVARGGRWCGWVPQLLLF
jgi:hypothetical protein